MDKKRDPCFWQSVFWGYVLMTCGFPIALYILVEQIRANTKEIFNNKGRK